MKRKLVSVLLIGALTVSVLAGCGNSDGSASSDSQGSGGTQSIADGEVVEITFGRGTTSNPKFPDGDTYEDNAYTRYVTEKLNVKVVDAFEANGDDYTRQVSLAIASGDLPDIMKVGKDELDELVENDLLADLTEVYEQYASDYIKNIYDSYEGRSLAAATYDGKLMALPGANVDGAPTMVWIRQDWADKLNLTIDEDGDGIIALDDVEQIAKAFVENDPSNSGNPVPLAFMPDLGCSDNSSSFSIVAITASMNAWPQQWIKNDAGEVVYGTVMPEMKEALTLLHKWFEEGLIDEQYGTRTWDDVQSAIVSEQCGIFFGPWHIPDWMLNNVHAMNKEAQFTPYAIANVNGKVNAFHANPSTPGFMVVSKNCAHPEVLVQLENLFYDELQTSKTLAQDAPEVFEYIQNAVDGTAKPWQVEVLSSYSLLEDYAEYTKCINGEMAIEDLSRLESKAIVEAVNAYQADPDTDDSNAWARYTSRLKGVALINKLTENDSFNWITPLYPSTTPTMRTAGANLYKIENEAVIEFITGARSLDEFDQFVSDWYAQGGETIKSEVAASVN